MQLIGTLSSNGDDERAVLVQQHDKESTVPIVTRFSFRKLWAFTGPGLLMSIGFLDPGNVTSDLQTGTSVKYELLWVLLGATVVGLILQRLSARLGVVTRLHLAELCFTHYKRPANFFLWIMVEIALIASDVQYKLSIAVAIFSLSKTLIPLWAGVLITTVDLLIFLYFDQHGLRRLEFFFGMLILVMAVTFGYEFVKSRPNFFEILEGVVIPRCRNCTADALLQQVSIVGSNVMPHNLFLHSALVKSRNVNSLNHADVSEANFYFFVESGLAVALSFLINMFIMTVFGDEVHDKTNHDIRVQCAGFSNSSMFNHYNIAAPDLYAAGLSLGCIFGVSAMFIWFIGILASAQSATMTVTYAGQYIVEGFFNWHWKAWQRTLFCKALSIVPTILFAFYYDTKTLTSICNILNTLISIQLPFAMLPTIAFSSNPRIMKDFTNGRIVTAVSLLLALAIIVSNVFFVFRSIVNMSWYVQIPIAAVGGVYVILYSYLVLHVLVACDAIKSKICGHLFDLLEENS
ncbi:hypothetical protein FQR65_LT14201 [Abscondita terminalis]|nr:hypothetical protein FQR65_LT14201 [Abscondita terminalis]